MTTKIALNHPYEDLTDGTWLRGNLHAHTIRSDGKLTPKEVVQSYRKKNYDFLMISDHDIFSSDNWLQALESENLTLIPGNEISAAGSHILHVHAGTHVTPDPDRQVVLNQIALDEQSFSIICHPNWRANFDHTSLRQLQEWTGYAGIEIYNGVIGRHDGTPYALDKWDILLSQGHSCWGYANDDSHYAEDIELGWNQVYVKEKTPESIAKALRQGRFYASTGVMLENIFVEGMHIHLETQNADRIAAVRDVGKRFAQVDDRSIKIEVPEDAKYVRFECWGRGEQMAWSQPFYVTKTEE